MLAALVACLPARAQAPASGPAAIDGIVQVADRAFRMSIPSGDARMFAAVHLAAGSAPAPTVVFRTGHLSGTRPEWPHPEVDADPDIPVLGVIRDRGWNVLALQYRGYWGSTGRFSYAHMLADTDTVVAYLRSERIGRALQVDGARVALLGSSMGGGAALLAAGHVPGLRCVAALAPFNMGAFLEAAQAKGGLESILRGPREGRMIDWVDTDEQLRDFSANVERYDVRRQLAPLAGRHVFVAAGTDDAVVPLAGLRALGDEMRTSGIALTYAELPDDHVFSRGQAVLGKRIAQWLHANCE